MAKPICITDLLLIAFVPPSDGDEEGANDVSDLLKVTKARAVLSHRALSLRPTVMSILSGSTTGTANPNA